MISKIILWTLGVVSPALITYFTGIYTIWWADLLMVISIPLFYLLWLGVELLILWIISLILGTKREIKKVHSAPLFVVKELVVLLLDLVRVKVIFTGKELLPTEKCMIVSNHISNFDPFPFNLYCKSKPLIYVTKPSIERIPIAGPMIHTAGYIVIDRDNAFEGVKAIVKGAKYIKENQASVYIFPEGTRNKGEKGTLNEFHAGSFKMALKAKCPLVIMSIRGTDDIKKNFPFKRTKVYYDVLKVLNYEDYKDMNTQELADLSANIISKKINEEII